MKKTKILVDKNQDYKKSLSSIVKKIEISKHEAIVSVNRLLINLNWFMGRHIVALQEKSKWGDKVVEKLAVDLRSKYPKQTGFSARNLWDCKRFFLTYRNYSKLRTVFAEISWSHNLLLLNKTKTREEKEFYLKMSLKERWSFRELQRQVDSAYYERFLLSHKPNKLAKIEQDKLFTPMKYIDQHLKDEYILEFLDLSKTFSEKELRRAILDNLRDFFLEFGKNLSFIGEEYPLVIDGQEYRIDLLFFHRELKCLVPIELKIGEFKPEYVGKMQFYLGALDQQIKLSHENYSIGLILCRSKKDSVVRLTINKGHRSIKVSAYQTKLPNRKLIRERLEKIKLPLKKELIKE